MSPSLITARGLWAAVRVLWRVVFRPLLYTAACLAFLLACDLFLFRDSLLQNLVYYRSDTTTYYFPIADRLVDVLREGRLILWTRYLFGGFPLFADGEAGMLYPPNLLAYLLLPAEEAFVWLRVARYFMAACFTFAYLRSLRLNGFAATIGAITFSFGSFMVTQMHHSNVGNTALWLPLTLFLVEMATRNLRRWRWVWATAAGASVGIQALGLHIQPLLMSGLLLALYIPFRVMLCPIAWPAPRKGARPACPDPAPPLAPRGIPDSLQSERERRESRAHPSTSPVASPEGARAPSMQTGGATKRVARAVGQYRQMVLARCVRAGARPAAALRSRASRARTGASAAFRTAWVDTVGPDWLEGEPGVREDAGWVAAQARRFASEARGIAVQVIVTTRRSMASVMRSCFSLLRYLARHFVSLAFRFVILVARIVAAAFHRTVLAVLLLGMIPTIAFGIAAVQVLPLVELGFSSFRSTGMTYEYATAFSMPAQNLVNLVFPYFFRYTSYGYWSLWSEWETTVYVGIAPLALAAVSVLLVRSRLVLFFTAMAAIAVLLALGDYSPYPLFERLRELPGFSSIRVPGRFNMLTTFSLAVLAAFGTDWLCRTLRSQSSGGGPQSWSARWRRFCRGAGVHGFALYLAGLLVAMAGTVWWLASFRMWIDRDPWAVKRLVQESYSSLRSGRDGLTPDAVLYFLNYSLDLSNQKTAASLAFMLATFLLLFCWFAFRRLWRIWAALLTVLVATDLLLFASDFHPMQPISRLSTPNAAARWLMAQNRHGRERVYTSWEVRKTEANRLLPFQVSEVGGYSSLETTRHQDYMANLNANESLLLDLYNTRFVVLPKRLPGLPSYESTAYYPDWPLAQGLSSNRGANATFYLDPPVKADEVRLISSIQGGTDILQDAEVADVVLVDPAGQRVTLRVRAGRDTAEWAYDRSDVTRFMGHRRPTVADQVWVTDPDGRNYKANLYLGKLKLDGRTTVSRVEFQYTYPKGKVRLYGIMLWENPSTPHQIIDRDRFVPRYEDDEVAILENPSRLPRAFLVPTARVIEQSRIVDTMVDGDFDPERVALLETRDKPRPLGLPDHGLADAQVGEWLRGNSDTPGGAAEILDYRSTEVTIQTVSDRNALLFLSDSYYPGWKAFVDGTQAKVYRADYLFRAVPVPKGTHQVRFVFEPESFAMGRDISLFTVSGLMALLALLVLGVPLFKGMRYAARRVWFWVRSGAR